MSSVPLDSSGDYWSSPIEDVYRGFDSVPPGLTTNEVAGRRDDSLHIGVRESSSRHLLFRQFRSPIILLLVVAAILSIVLGEVVDATIVIGSLVLSGGFGYIVMIESLKRRWKSILVTSSPALTS